MKPWLCAWPACCAGAAAPEKSSIFSSRVDLSRVAWKRYEVLEALSSVSKTVSPAKTDEQPQPATKARNRTGRRTRMVSASAASFPVKAQTIRLSAFDEIKAAHPNPRCSSPAIPGVGWPHVKRYGSLPKRANRVAVIRVASDSLVDDRGCLNNWPESQSLPRNVNLQCCRSLDSTRDQ